MPSASFRFIELFALVCRVLIHAAAGGIGLAAIQLAAAAGAHVLATAGSPAKRALLRRLGARHVSSSRDTAFVTDLAMVRVCDRWYEVMGHVHRSCRFIHVVFKVQGFRDFN